MIEPVRIHPTIPAMRILMRIELAGMVPNPSISTGRLPKNAPREILIVVTGRNVIFAVSKCRRIRSLIQRIPKVAPNDSQNAISYTGESGDIIVRIPSASANIAILDPLLPNSAKR